MATLPRHVICFLGNWKDFTRIDNLIRTLFPGFHLDTEFSALEPEARARDAFAASFDSNESTAQDDDWAAIDRHSAVAYVLSPPMRRADSESVSGEALLLVDAMLRIGATAAKNESAGFAHGRLAWLELAADFRSAYTADDKSEMGSALYRSWVRRPLRCEDTNLIYSCGMHLLGYRDCEFAPAESVRDALRWIDLLNLYICFDRPKRKISDGDGFRLATDGPRRIIRHHTCDRYADDDFFHNPYGYNRLVDPVSD